jgi:phosphopantothenoylcysteine synthetase/decarboxylase
MGLKNKKILVTCGPTWVALDAVRIISNCSTGTLGHLIARSLARSGAKVTVLEGPVVSPLKDRTIRVCKFIYFEELAALLKTELKKKYAAVIHAAAVADFTPAKKISEKIPSEKKRLTLRLKATPKLIGRIKKLAPKTFLVGFKLEPAANIDTLRRQAAKLIRACGCDLVVANSLKSGYHARIIDQNKNILAAADSRVEVATKLRQILKGKI